MIQHNFHTIKSILNADDDMWLAEGLLYFHTIKSILNYIFDMS